ncbi:regulatory protein RecX [uncultured Bifidobacterium sp.]|uniref:regulatory protein RecX n=1 Tax=uncultured Bifidobacterium sp. TaxID=165187 RepID=UPI002618B5C6|nr:regulatory protein RecX [uncultured Bifidobacterium sp.]
MIDVDGFLRSHPVAVESDARNDDFGQRHSDGLIRGDASFPRSPHHGRTRDAEDGGCDACRESALRLLDAAPRSSQAMRERLIAKEYPREVVDDVVESLIRVGLIDDEKYARMLLDHCLKRCMGSRGVAVEFSRRRVDRNLADDLLAHAKSEGLFLESARRMAESVRSRTRGCDRRTCLRRLWATAGREGHESEDVRTVAREFFDQW